MVLLDQRRKVLDSFWMAPREDPEKFLSADRQSVHSSATSTGAAGSALSHEYENQETALTPRISQVSIRDRPPLSRKATSIGTTGTTDPNYEVDWDDEDTTNPRNWPLCYKGLTIGFISWSTWVYGFSYIP